MLKTFRTYQLAKTLYQSCRGLKLKNPVKDQFERALLSTLLNTAEGSGKLSGKDRRRFYAIAMGSLRETQALLEIIENCNEQLILADRVGASLYRLIQNPGGSE